MLTREGCSESMCLRIRSHGTSCSAEPALDARSIGGTCHATVLLGYDIVDISGATASTMSSDDLSGRGRNSEARRDRAGSGKLCSFSLLTSGQLGLAFRCFVLSTSSSFLIERLCPSLSSLAEDFSSPYAISVLEWRVVKYQKTQPS